MRGTHALLALLAGACHRGPTLREQVLAEIPAGATAVVAATGAALHEPVPNAAWGQAAYHLPMDHACALDAARAADEVALGFSAHGATLVLATHGTPTCPELHAIDREPGLWRATIGDVPPTAGSILDDDRFARARPYLLEARAALAASIAEPRAEIIAATGAGSAEGWMTIDAADPDALVARAARWQDAGARAHLTIGGARGQTLVRFADVDGELGFRIVEGMVTWLEPVRSATPVADVLPCPPHGLVDRCARDRWFVESLPLAWKAIADHLGADVRDPGARLGLRLATDAPALGLVRDDEIVSVDGRVVTTPSDLRWSGAAKQVVGIRRGGQLTTIELVSE